MWIGHRCSRVPSILNPPNPPGCHTAPAFLSALRHTANSHWLRLLILSLAASQDRRKTKAAGIGMQGSWSGLDPAKPQGRQAQVYLPATPQTKSRERNRVLPRKALQFWVGLTPGLGLWLPALSVICSSWWSSELLAASMHFLTGPEAAGHLSIIFWCDWSGRGGHSLSLAPRCDAGSLE